MLQSFDETIVPDSDPSCSSTETWEDSGAGGGGSETGGNSAGSHPKVPKNTTRKRKASSSGDARYVFECLITSLQFPLPRIWSFFLVRSQHG